MGSPSPRQARDALLGALALVAFLTVVFVAARVWVLVATGHDDSTLSAAVNILLGVFVALATGHALAQNGGSS